MNSIGKILLLVVMFAAGTFVYFYISPKSGSENTTAQSPNMSMLSNDEISGDIDSILYTFGIRKEWIKETGIKEKDPKKPSEQLLLSKEVRIPQDLPTIDLNYEITNYLRTYGLDNTVTEEPRTKNISMEIFSIRDTIQKQTAALKFIYTDSLRRKAADVCIVLDSIDVLSLADAENILNSTQTYSVFLPLRNDKADYQSKIMELKKDYLIKFSVGDENDIEADFKEGMKESLWKSKIKSLNINFPGVSAVILINRIQDTEFYNSVKEEFVKNNITVYPESVFTKFKAGESKSISLFENIILESKAGKRFLFYDVYFSPDEFDSFDRQVYNIKKLGYKFFNFKELMSRSKVKS